MKAAKLASPRAVIRRRDNGAPVEAAKPARSRMAVSHRARGKRTAKINARVGGR